MDTENALVPPSGHNPSIRTVDVNRSVEWLAGGFRMFMKNPGIWVLATLALIIGAWLLGFILPDLLSGPANTIVAIVAVGALMRACQAQDEGRDFTSGVQAAASSAPLWILGLIAAALNFGLALLTGLLGLSSMGVFLMTPSLLFHALGFGALIIFAVSVLLGMALWLAPALVVLRGVSPIDAIKLSLLGSLKNIVPYIIYSLLVIMLCIVAAIPLGLGLLVAIPMLICSAYLAYKDIFGA
jgi:uncharacterized membrane protein